MENIKSKAWNIHKTTQPPELLRMVEELVFTKEKRNICYNRSYNLLHKNSVKKYYNLQ